MLRDNPLIISIEEDAASGTRIYTLNGPVTLPNLFDLQSQLRDGECPSAVILDFKSVPYMDSAGMGAIINHFVHCRKLGVKLITVGICNRVQELFILTKVDTVIPCRATLDEALALV
jgi:anti-sigma B factor antagonist